MSEAVGVVPPNRYGHGGQFVCLLKALKVIFHFLVVGEILFKNTSVINGYEPAHPISVLCSRSKSSIVTVLFNKVLSDTQGPLNLFLPSFTKGGLFVFEVFKRFFHVLSS